MRFTCVHLAFVCLLHATSHIELAHGLEWILEDAIHLTAEIEPRSPEDQLHRLPGKCVKLRECYPILFLTDRSGGDEPASINSDLISFILETSDVCKPTGYTANNTSHDNPGEVFVWCRLRSVLQKESLSLSGAKPLVDTKADEDGVCNFRKVLRDEQDEERVVGGSEIAVGDAPYSVAIMFRGKQVCGGSVIDEHHILTAAHCVSHLKATVLHQLKLFIGDHDIKNAADVEHQERNVSKVIYHKEFSADTLHDDIAMIKVADPIVYSGAVSPICLFDGSITLDDGTTNGKLVGWGQLEEGGDRPNTPRSASLRIWKTEECEDVYDGIVPEDIFEKALCAGGFQDGGTTDACKGDSGGPFTITRNKKQFQIGVVSFGIGCGRYPGVFTKVSEYQSWIDRHRTAAFSI